jgi:hypothetical protein
MRVSKYLKVDRNVLLEYIYDDGNVIGEAYNIGVNIKNRIQNYIAVNTSSTINTQANTLFLIDSVVGSYGKFDPTKYNFLQLKEYASGFPIRHDTVKLYFPINWTFGEYQGIYIRVYGFDVNNKNVYDLANFYYDKSNIEQNENNSILDFINPPLYFQEKLWGKAIQVDIPSLFAVSNQRGAAALKSNNLNSTLTEGIGFNQQSPIFIDFRFIQSSSTINNLTTYQLTSRTTFTLPQSPEFESIGLTIEESRNGDFFEIFATYNGNIGEFNDFINRTVSLGNRYYVEYNITTWEQNIKGKTQRLVVTEDFLSKIEYRPIIKTSTTTAIIDVEMNLIDAVNNSRITRRASFGMLQDMVSKYSARLMKINLSDANKPKIYNLKQTITQVTTGQAGGPNSTMLETIKVPYPVLIDRFNVVAKSDNAYVSGQSFWGIGKMMIKVYPFDNVFKFVIANQVVNGRVEYLDMTNLGEIKMVFRNQNISAECGLFVESGENNLATGFVVFKLSAGKIPDVRKVSESGINVFYITSTQQSTTTVIYSGLFKIYDSEPNVVILNEGTVEPPVEVVESPAAITPVSGNDAFAIRRSVNIVTQEQPGGVVTSTVTSVLEERLTQDVLTTTTPEQGAMGIEPPGASFDVQEPVPPQRSFSNSSSGGGLINTYGYGESTGGNFSGEQPRIVRGIEGGPQEFTTIQNPNEA